MRMVKFVSYGDLYEEFLKKIKTVESDRAFDDCIRNWVGYIVAQIEKELDEDIIISRETKALFVERMAKAIAKPKLP